MLQLNCTTAITPPIQFGLDKLDCSCKRYPLGSVMQVVLAVSDVIATQGYCRRVADGKVYLDCADESGAMYALLDLAQALGHVDGDWEQLESCTIDPYIDKRGIKFNIPLDVRTPSYSDGSDSASDNIAAVWEQQFWRDYLDEMALQKYNVLSLWSLSPFPSLVYVPEYPMVALADVKASVIPPRPEMSGALMFTEDMLQGLYTIKKMSIEEKIAFWQWVMEYAQSRCIEVYLFTWNLFVFGTEDTPYGITDSQDNLITQDYLYHSVKVCLETYPLLAGIGITSGENMKRDKTDISFLRNTYGRAVEEYVRENPNRNLRLIHRMQYAMIDEILEQYDGYGAPFEISFKYSQAHMHSSTKPAFFEQFLSDCDDARVQDKRFWMTLRDDDYYMYRWGDPSFARQYLCNMPRERMSGFYLGADGYTWGNDYSSAKADEVQLYPKKMWYKWMIWGQLAYNPHLGDSWFAQELRCRYGDIGCELFPLWAQASSAIATVNQIHWHNYDFQWYPEGCCMFLHPPVAKLVFADIREFMTCPAMPGCGWLSTADYARRLVDGTAPKTNNTAGAADKLVAEGKQILQQLETLFPIAEHLHGAVRQDDLLQTLEDIRLLALLGQYYGYKLNAAIQLNLYRYQPQHIHYHDLGVEHLHKAADVWKRYSSLSKKHYRAQWLARLCSYVDLQRFDRSVDLDLMLAQDMKL